MDQEQIDELNDLMRLMLPDINAGKEPDYEALAEETGFDQDTIRELAEQAAGMINKQKDKK